MDSLESPVEDLRVSKSHPDEKKLAVLEEILRDACERRVRIVLVQSPGCSIACKNTIAQRIADLAKKHHVRFINAINQPQLFDQPQFFKDPAHLYHQGAVVFTGMVVEHLRELAAEEQRALPSIL